MLNDAQLQLALTRTFEESLVLDDVPLACDILPISVMERNDDQPQFIQWYDCEATGSHLDIMPEMSPILTKGPKYRNTLQALGSPIITFRRGEDTPNEAVETLQNVVMGAASTIMGHLKEVLEKYDLRDPIYLTKKHCHIITVGNVVSDRHIFEMTLHKEDGAPCCDVSVAMFIGIALHNVPLSNMASIMI